MTILGQVEASLEDFRPRTTREFVALQIATRFNDRRRLARYLNISRMHPNRTLLETARIALEWEASQRATAADAFFQLLQEAGTEAAV